MFRSPVLLIVSTLLTGVAEATPTASYYPLSGEIEFTNIGFPGVLKISSTGSLLLSSPVYLPRESQLIDNMPTSISWLSTQYPIPTLFYAGSVVIPGTPLADLSFAYSMWDGVAFGPSQPGIVAIAPEPSSLTLAVLGVLAIRRSRTG